LNTERVGVMITVSTDHEDNQGPIRRSQGVFIWNTYSWVSNRGGNVAR